MIRKPKAAKVEAKKWAVVRGAEMEVLGWFKSEAEAKCDAAGRHMHLSNNIRATAFVPFDPDAARVLKAAEKWVEARFVSHPTRLSSVMKSGDALRAAVERRQKRGAK